MYNSDLDPSPADSELEDLPADTITTTTANQWGDEAASLLANIIGGRHFRKKRLTLLLMADAALYNRPLTSVMDMSEAGSRITHYKWRKVDPAYEAAYMFLVGDHAAPGQARILRERNLDADELRAISSLAEARTQLKLASADAVQTLIESLDASNKWGPKWHERILAANSILDRADSETAVRSAPALALVDAAIMNVYGAPPADDASIVITDGQASLLDDQRQPTTSESSDDDDMGHASHPIADAPPPDEDAADLDQLAAFFSHVPPTTEDQADQSASQHDDA